jgi:adhesin HecA-like repeat protein
MIKKSFALVFVVAIIIMLGVLGIGIVLRSISETRIADKNKESIQAFWLAEAGISRAVAELKTNYNQSGTNLWRTAMASGGYYVDVTVSGQNKDVVSHGFIPFSGALRVDRSIEAILAKNIPPNFYNNAIYSAGTVDLNGSAYSITGQVRYAGTIDNTGNVNGEIINDPSINPLAKLSFTQLLSISQTQANVYAYNAQGKLVNQATGSQTFPSSFWYQAPSDPDNPATGVPNVIYVEGDLQLKGNIGAIGGFFVVVGDVITNPDATYDATINGNGTVEGAIYTRGEFRINGGGGNLNINGGVWAGEEARLNGNANITYNAGYMSAIQALGIDADVQIISWKEQQGPYELVP